MSKKQDWYQVLGEISEAKDLLVAAKSAQSPMLVAVGSVVFKERWLGEAGV